MNEYVFATRGLAHAHFVASGYGVLVMEFSFPRVEFPLYSLPHQARGEPRKYLESRLNVASTGSLSAAVVGANGALKFRRSGGWSLQLSRLHDAHMICTSSGSIPVRGRCVHYHTPCLPLGPPNTRLYTNVCMY